jgi:hypothetical protein
LIINKLENTFLVPWILAQPPNLLIVYGLVLEPETPVQAVGCLVGFACKRIFSQLCRYVFGSINMAHLFTHAQDFPLTYPSDKETYLLSHLSDNKFCVRNIDAELNIPGSNE